MLLAPAATRWVCDHCNARDVTTEAAPHTRYHTCPGLKGISAPMVREGDRVKVEVRLREDYVRSERVTTDDDGRPVMAVVTTRDDGTDCAVFAPVATARTA
jgi:hypothetical protein